MRSVKERGREGGGRGWDERDFQGVARGTGPTMACVQRERGKQRENLLGTAAGTILRNGGGQAEPRFFCVSDVLTQGPREKNVWELEREFVRVC